MLFLIVSFLAAFVVTLLVVRSSAHHAHLSGDTDKDQPQKFHARVVPREMRQQRLQFLLHRSHKGDRFLHAPSVV